ncbi:Patatin and Ank 2 and Ank domain containing prote in [Trichuris trichiura]|uniref:phospholipase A2 n=1 Tax=Trichuris trichiura TaxID=36087 RepID=A0A077Z513_TRITR|nr:Patatin and Ank 2 and Ank domain containing prote in [Trichuris trichiura]
MYLARQYIDTDGCGPCHYFRHMNWIPMPAIVPLLVGIYTGILIAQNYKIPRVPVPMELYAKPHFLPFNMSDADDNPNSRRQLTKLLGNMVKVARERIMGRQNWLPRNNDTVVEVPEQFRDSVKTVAEFEPFQLFHSMTGSNIVSALYHIGLKCNKTLFSIVRWATEQEALEHLDSIRPFSALFLHIEQQMPGKYVRPTDTLLWAKCFAAPFRCSSMERLMYAIKKHPLWNPVHIAAEIGIKGYFEKLLEDETETKRYNCIFSTQNLILSRVLHSMCQPEGRYPLHIAVENSQTEIVKFMLEKLKVNPSQVDKLGQNSLHYAAQTSAEMIGVLTASDRLASCINALSKDGYTPLFMAVASARPSCAAALLKQGARLDVYCHGRSAVHEAMLQKGPKVFNLIRTLHAASPESFNIAEAETGNSALHVAGNKQTILALLACNPEFNLESRNFNGQTALHLHTYNSNLPCVVVLICKNANIDAHDEDGNTSLHIAISVSNRCAMPLVIFDWLLKNQNESITKLLLLFGADPNVHVKNKVKDGKKVSVVLALDGGGTRGVVIVQTLLMIEQRLKIPLYQIVDWVAGTSTGALLGTAIALGKSLKIAIIPLCKKSSSRSLRNVQKLYMLLKDDIFEGQKRPYSSSRMEESLKSIVGPSTTMADVTSKKLVITSVLIKNHPLRLHIFRNYQLPELLLWKVLRCTTAAPTYFSSVDNMYVDGGLMANNPSLDTLTEIHRYNCAVELANEGEKVEVGCFLSVGTGRTPERPLPVINFDSSNPLELLPAAMNYISVVMNQLTATEGAPVDRARSWCQDLNIPYFRFCTPLSKHFFLDTTSDEDMKVMGETWWLPSSPKEIVEIPPKALKTLQEIDRKDIFGIRHGSDEKTSDDTFHITMDWKNGKHILSLCRCSNLEDAYDHFNNLIYFLPLFSFIESRKRLDSLLQCIRRHSLWKPVHIAAMLGIRKYFENVARQEPSKISEQLNQICQPEGRYPLHIAVENCHVDLALYMINVLKVPISLPDLNGQNVFHYAAGASPSVVTALAECEGADKQINILSKDGYTPLFMSIISCKPTCTTALIKKGAVWDIMCNGRSAVHQAMLQDGSKVKECVLMQKLSLIIKTLVEASPDMIRDAEPQTGNSALHIAGNKQALSSLFLVCSNLDVELRNKAGQTALHMHVHHGNLGCTLVLLYNGANPDAQDSNGNTSLHLAVSSLNVDIAKALLVLGANPNILNNTGDSPRHLAARLGTNARELLSCLVIGGAVRCNMNHRGCVAGCMYRNSVEDEVTSECTSGKKLKFLLSLDGGGIRGLILVQMLIFIESFLDKPLISYVDWLAGTSTGAILAASLARGKSLRQCQVAYLRMKDLLFEDRKRPYDTDAMERHVKEHVGLEARMTDITKPKLIITSVLAQKHPVRLHIFRSYTLPGEDRIPCRDPDSCEEMPLWKVLRCSSAAPTYFTSVDNKFVDGGLIANNPSVDLLSEIQLYKMALEYTVGSLEYAGYVGLNVLQKSTEELEIGCLLNLGTGRIPDMPIESLNVGISSPIGMVGVLKNLGYMIMDQVTATEGRPADRAKAWCNEMGVPFFRFSPQMTKDYLLDTKTDREVVMMMWETVEYMQKRKEECYKLVNLIKALNQQ